MSIANEDPRNQNQDKMQLIIEIGDHQAKAELYENEASRDFAALLPLSLVLEDYARTEKVAQLPGKLSLTGVPEGFDPSVGDLTYYAPWGNLALFYKDFGYAKGLVSLGKITDGLEYFQVDGSLKVVIRIDKTISK